MLELDDNFLIFQSSFNRPNLTMKVKQTSSPKDYLQDLVKVIKKYENEPGIIYCLSRRRCVELSEKLNELGFKTYYYFAGGDEELTGLKNWEEKRK